VILKEFVGKQVGGNRILVSIVISLKLLLVYGPR
jgi:hypothetical protein